MSADESDWAEIRQAFPAPRGPTNLFNSGGGRTPQAILDRLARLVAIAAAGGEAQYPDLRELSESGASPAIRSLLAAAFGCAPDEIALTRNAMEGLAVALHGIDLVAGDEVVTTRADYDSCIEILRQRGRRDGIVLKLIDIALPAASEADVISRFEEAITARTRLILCSHMINKNGQILPVRGICAMARRRGVVTVVDGAQAAGHIDFRLSELGCDIYASSLHKWFFAPRGTGFLHVRHDRIAEVWPIWASWSGKPRESIEKFEEHGTSMKAVAATLPDVAAFNAAIGPARKEARLRQLRDLWLMSLARIDRIRLLTDAAASRSCGIGAFVVDGISSDELARRLLAEHDIIVGSVRLPELPDFQAVSVATTLTNTPVEVERFVDAVTQIVRRH